ncbi:MAG TPA: redoxin domain-containing protein [Edaphobacter sp.]|jgi:thiol-disulfide isomerase/thioredoxin
MRPSTLPALLLLCHIACLPTLQAQSPDYKSNPKFVSAIAEAKQLERQRQYGFAIDAYKKACKIAEGKDNDCLIDLYTLQMKTGGFKDAAITAASLEAIAPNPIEKSYAETKRGHALLYQAGDKNKADLLNAAEAAFKSAIADNPKNASAHYLDGQVLARLNQIDAARDQFKTCLTCVSPNDPSYLRAQHFAEDPTLSTHPMAPPFTVTALDGSKFNLDAMGGRVVLIDFWATWCGPCNEELPHMKKIAKEFAGQPLVIISVSWDSDETKWKKFIDKNEMNWIQYRDADHHLSNLFQINSIPHYFTIDSDGVLTAEMMGTGSDVEGKLKKLIARAKPASPAGTTQVGN